MKSDVVYSEKFIKKVTMNLHIEILIKDITTNLPEFLRPNDLVACGLYKSRSDVCWAMKRGQAPPSIKLTSHKIIFPRASLCEWLKEKAKIEKFKSQHGQKNKSYPEDNFKACKARIESIEGR